MKKLQTFSSGEEDMHVNYPSLMEKVLSEEEAFVMA